MPKLIIYITLIKFNATKIKDNQKLGFLTTILGIGWFFCFVLLAKVRGYF
jgi:hypothetical protein